MIDLYYWPTPNGHKITMFLEEAGLDYTIHPVDISAGDQFKPDFLAISPNNRMPAIIDTVPSDGGEPISVFESGAILLYFAEKTGRFLPKDVRGRKAAADGCFCKWGAGTDGRTEPPFRHLRAKQNSLCDRPLRKGDGLSLRRARPSSRKPHIHRRRLQRCRYDFLSLDRSMETAAAEPG